MKAEDKKKKIKETPLVEFRLLIQTLLECFKFVDIKEGSKPNMIFAKEKGILGEQSLTVILSTELLSGDKVVDREFIENTISDRIKSNSKERIIIASTHNISEGFKGSIESKNPNTPIIFWGTEELVAQIDEKNADYWFSSDKLLSVYEKDFLQTQSKIRDLSKLKVFGEKHEKLLSVFIDPKLLKIRINSTNEKEFICAMTVRQIAFSQNSGMISGEAGTGKTTILKKIGEFLFEWNRENQEAKRKYLPIFMDYVDILDCQHSIQKVIDGRLSPTFGDQEFGTICEKYKIVLLIDSLDEFGEGAKGKLLNQIRSICSRMDLRFLVASRNFDAPFDKSSKKDFDTFIVERFDFQRARAYLQSVFKSEDSKIDDLMDSLEENRILDRMPITPLTLSLISILYEEKKYEIPATITDIFDLFNAFLLGKLNVSSRLDFLDINVRERILSHYAFEVMQRNEHAPMTVDEFNAFFKNFFHLRGIVVSEDLLYEALKYLIDNTGILQIQDRKYVQFHNDSFMEYYAAVEIFHHQRAKEEILFKRFLDPSWQNAAIFYAGKSKDMPDFLEAIIGEVSQSSTLPEYISGVMGLGYLLQALYMTNNGMRTKGVETALELNLRTYDAFKTFALQENFIFKKLSLIGIAVVPLVLFRQNFNSITLKEPMRKAFENKRQQLNREHIDASSDGFAMVELATTLATERINDLEPIQELMSNHFFGRNSLFVNLLELGIEMIRGDDLKEVKRELSRQSKKLKNAISSYSQPISDAVFGPADLIHSKRKVNLTVEGKWDAMHLQRSFEVLSGKKPYWRILPSAMDFGGAHEVTKTLLNSNTILDDDQILIGIFDNDTKGFGEWHGGLKEEIFEISSFSPHVKKHRRANIYGICIPIPPAMEQYQQEEHRFKFFELEHYYPTSLLQELNALDRLSINDQMFEIRKSAKSRIADRIKKESDPQVFKGFEPLFRLIDHISGLGDQILYR